jgi:hypothetical protein
MEESVEGGVVKDRVGNKEKEMEESVEGGDCEGQGKMR